MDQDTMARTPHSFELAAPQYGNGCAWCGLHVDASVHRPARTWFERAQAGQLVRKDMTGGAS